MTTPLPQRLTYTPDELADALRISPSSVRARCERGEINAKKTGRFWRIPRREYLRLLGEEEAGHEDHGGDVEARRRDRELRELVVDLEVALQRARRILGEMP